MEPQHTERIRYAAELANTSVSSFVVDAAVEKADRIIAATNETMVPADFFDSLLSSLDDAATIPALRKASSRARDSVKPR